MSFIFAFTSIFITITIITTSTMGLSSFPFVSFVDVSLSNIRIELI